MNDQPQVNSMWVTGYTPDGFKVSFTLLLDREGAIEEWLTYIRKAGIMPREPGLNTGEQTEEIGWILKTLHKGETPRIFLYPSKEVYKFKWTSVWFNTAADEAAFENATGLKYSTLPAYPGTAFKRGENPQVDKQYLVPLTPPVKIVWANDPKFDPKIAGPQTHEQREFVRWANVTAQPPAAETVTDAKSETSGKPGYDKAAVHELVNFLYEHPKHTRASLDKLMNHTDTEQKQWWIPATASTLVAAYTVLLYKAATTEGVELEDMQVLTVLGVKRLGEWASQYEDAGEGLRAAWAKLKEGELAF